VSDPQHVADTELPEIESPEAEPPEDTPPPAPGPRKVLRRWVRDVGRAGRKFVLSTLYSVYALVLPMDRTAVVLFSDRQVENTGNFHFISRALEGSNMRVIVADKPTKRHRRSFSEKLAAVRTLATSKYVLLEDYSPFIGEIRPRGGQVIIQTWHASGAFKKIGYSRLTTGKSPGRGFHNNYTYAIVGGEANRAPYAEGFGMPIENVQALGLPRTDKFFDPAYTSKTREAILAEYPGLVGKKVVLFAPTFRGVSSPKAYFDWDQLDFDAIAKTLGGDYVFLIKPHPYIYWNLERPRFAEHAALLDKAYRDHPGFYIDMGAFPDINDLLLVTDIMVTDYSSVVFEQSLLNKPIVFFAYDYEEYLADRGFYFDFSEYTYGPIARTSEELAHCLLEARVDEEKLAAFRAKFTAACDGHAAERFVRTYFAGDIVFDAPAE
jgi:CDP-ribitol ribitolphosphotransferase / teichoic acid ribitol-phosphate polymerase